VNVKEVPRMRNFKGWTILNEAYMRTTRWEMREGLLGNVHWRKVDVGILCFVRMGSHERSVG